MKVKWPFFGERKIAKIISLIMALKVPIFQSKLFRQLLLLLSIPNMLIKTFSHCLIIITGKEEAMFEFCNEKISKKCEVPKAGVLFF